MGYLFKNECNGCGGTFVSGEEAIAIATKPVKINKDVKLVIEEENKQYSNPVEMEYGLFLYCTNCLSVTGK